MKTVTKPKNILSVDAQAAAVNSATYDVTYLDNVGVQVIWANGSDAPAGEIEVWATIDGTNFSKVTLSGPPAVSGNSGSLIISLTDFCFDKFYVRWARTAGTIDLDISVMARSTGR